MEFSGRLATVSLGDVLQWAVNDRWSGTLVVRRRGHEKRILLAGGQVIGCLSDDPAEFFGRHLLLNGHLHEDALAEALAHCTEHHRRLGESLEELELLDTETIRDALGAQISDLVCGAFLWRQGVFFLEAGRPARGGLAPRPLDTFTLVMEGTRWLDEVGRIRERLPTDRTTVRRGRRWRLDGLPPLALHIAAAVDGDEEIGELYRRLGGSQFRFLETVHGLCGDGVLEVADAGAGEAPPPASDLSLLDLLLERAAAEERALESGHQLTIPLDVLVHLVPCWVGGPDEEDLGELSGPLYAFAAGIDGHTPLSALLSPDAETRSRQTDLLLVELGRGRLALLPEAPPGDDDAG